MLRMVFRVESLAAMSADGSGFVGADGLKPINGELRRYRFRSPLGLLSLGSHLPQSAQARLRFALLLSEPGHFLNPVLRPVVRIEGLHVASSLEGGGLGHATRKRHQAGLQVGRADAHPALVKAIGGAELCHQIAELHAVRFDLVHQRRLGFVQLSVTRHLRLDHRFHLFSPVVPPLWRATNSTRYSVL